MNCHICKHVQGGVGAMIDARSLAFIDAMRKMRMPTDDPIEHTSFSGGGLRFAGFKRLPGRSFANILLEYGKRAIINMCAGGPDELYADCYDDIDPPQLDAVTPSSMVPAPARATQDYTRGAVVYSAYICSNMSSACVKRLLLGPGVVDVILTPAGFKVMKICANSQNVVGGLSAQIQTNSRMRSFQRSHRQTLSTLFKPGVPRRLKRPVAGWLQRIGIKSKRSQM